MSYPIGIAVGLAIGNGSGIDLWSAVIVIAVCVGASAFLMWKVK